MAIGKKRGGGSRDVGGIGATKRNARRQAAISLAQKAATENASSNRQIDGARAAGATPGHAQASAGSASLMGASLAPMAHAPTPSRLDEKLAHEKAMQEARFGEAERERRWKSGESSADRAWRSAESQRGRDEAAAERAWRSRESVADRDWRSGESAAERDWKSREAQLGREESARERDWRSSEAELGRKFTAGESKEERALRERMNNASLQNQFLINAANQAAADRRAREALRSSERIKEMGLRGDAAKYDYNLALQELKNRGAIDLQHERGATALDLADANNAVKIALGEQKGMYAAGRDAAKYAHELELRGIDNEEWRRRQEFTDRIKSGQEDRQDARRRFAEDEKLVNAGTHEWGYTPEQQQTIDELWHTYDEAIENGEADEDDLRELEAQIQSKIDAMPKRAIRRTDVEALANDRFLWKDDGRVFDVQTGRLVDKPDKEQKTAEQIAGGIYTLPDGTKVYSDGNALKQVPSSIPKDPTYADYQKYLRDFEKNKDVVSNPDAQPMSAQDFVKQWRDFNGALRPNDVQGNNPNGFSNEDWAWITEQFNAGNLTDMELRSLGLTVVNGALVPIDYGAEAGSAAPARTNAPAPSASAPSAATAGTGTVNLNAPATTADERRNKWAARARR